MRWALSTRNGVRIDNNEDGRGSRINRVNRLWRGRRLDLAETRNGTWVTGATHGLLSQQSYRWTLPTELVSSPRKRRKNQIR